MTRTSITSIVLAGLLAAGCGERMERLSRDAEALRQVVSTDVRTDRAEAISSERVARGDTLPGASDRLTRALPDNVENFTLSGTGEGVRGGGVWVQRGWKDDDGRILSITVTDHGNAGSVERAKSAPYLTPGSTDNTIRPLDNLPDNVAGSMKLDQGRNLTTATVGVRYRYTVELEAGGADDDATMLLADLAGETARRLEEIDR